MKALDQLDEKVMDFVQQYKLLKVHADGFAHVLNTLCTSGQLTPDQCALLNRQLELYREDFPNG